MYQWWVFVHLVGVFGFLMAHGVSVMVLFRLRVERDPRRVNDYLQLSATSTRGFYASLGVLLVGGSVAGFLGHLWSYGWIWGAIIVLVVTSLAMLGMARPYYRRVRLVARALSEGSAAVSAEQFDGVLKSSRPTTIAAIGSVGLLVILYLMLFQPTLGFAPASTSAPPRATSSAPSGPSVTITARGTAFTQTIVGAPASQPFSIVFANADPGGHHNVAIYTDASASTVLFRGALITGAKTVVYRVGALPPGTYFFRCDVHPSQMKGTFEVR
jgi:Cupredoxin-like domain